MTQGDALGASPLQKGTRHPVVQVVVREDPLDGDADRGKGLDRAQQEGGARPGLVGECLGMLTSAEFRQRVMSQVPDQTLWAWWHDNYDQVGRAFQQQIANPVTTKVGRFQVTEAARLTLGRRSPRSIRALFYGVVACWS